MKCGLSENRIALYVEGDLQEGERPEVELHLQDCARCREFADELRESQSVFKSLRSETVAAAALAGVRERVLAEVNRGWLLQLEQLLFLGLRRRVALAGVAVAVLLSASAGYLMYGPEEEVAVPATGPVHERPAHLVTPVQEKIEAAPSAVRKAAAAVPGRRAALRPKPAHVEAVPEALEALEAPEARQIVVKLLTEDPNIVIYWLVDEKGEQQ